MLKAAFTLAAMLRNMMAVTTCAVVAASTSADQRVPAQDGSGGLLGLRDDGQSFAVSRLLGIAEDHLPQVSASVVDLDAVAFHDRLDDGHHRIEDIRYGFGIRPTPLERFGVACVLHEQQEFTFGLGVEKQGPGADVRLVGDLLGRDILDAVLGEQLAGGRGDTVQLLLLVPLTPSDRLGGERHEDGSSGNRF